MSESREERNARQRKWRKETEAGRASVKRQIERRLAKNMPEEEKARRNEWERERLDRSTAEQRAARAATAAAARKRRMAALWAGAFAAYGSTCRCCGEATPEFLTIDHVNGGGGAHRQEHNGSGGVLKWLRNHGYPDGFQILCFNCNCGRARNGGTCPHEKGPE